MVDVLTEQMAEIDKEIWAAEEKMLPATPVHNNRSPKMLMVKVASS
jgi:hypothetical protein